MEEKKAEDPKDQPNVEHSEHQEHPSESPVSQASQPTSNLPEKKKMKLSPMKIILAIVVLILIILIVLVLTNVISLKPAQYTTKETYNLTYSVYSNGTLIGTQTSTFAKDSVAASLGFASNKLDEEINAMQQGEEKNITLEPKDAFGIYDPSLVFALNRTEVTEASGLPSRINRTSTQNRTLDVSTDIFTQAFSEQPILNKIYTRSSINYKVTKIIGDNVTLSIELKVGDTFPSGLSSFGLNTTVTAVTDETITVRIDGVNQVTPSEIGDLAITLDNNYVYFEFTPTIGKSIELSGYPNSTVIQVNSTYVLFDANALGAGETITVDVKLLKKAVEKGPVTGSSIKNIPGAPTFQFFIMSHCPYGTQMAKGVIPVWEKFKDKANIELRFVSYTMHGAQEDLDNNRLICIREEQSAKLIEYLKCFVYGDGSEASSQSCIVSTGVDKAKLDSCVATSAATYMETDKALNTQYGVQGSPTVVINGKESSVYPRDPATVAKALCDAFTTKPAECSFAFDTTNPSAGFGGGTASSSGSASSCG
ncbi:MAG: thioredoxin domain-containing protein [Candidatus Pacearchaeota archaeon]|nr:thioredoxin domain-containing protein [Candidatus Pacearchaeota archaeon]